MPKKKKRIFSIKDHSVKIMAIILVSLVLGISHGLYASAESSQKQVLESAEALCHGEFISGNFKVDKRDVIIDLDYKIIVQRGNVDLLFYMPDGSLFFNKSDSKSIFRQNLIKIKNNDYYGVWSYRIECNKADITYDLEIEVSDSKKDLA